MYSKVDGIVGFKYNNDVYYYIKNAQNGIVGILDSNYNEVAKYEYDSFGNILSIKDAEGNSVTNDLTHIGNINSYRYRSYYYDTETNLYYLNFRYYNPVWGRFMNADGIINDGSYIYQNGYYYIIDRYNDINKDKTTIIDSFRYSVNVDIFIYDSDNKEFYYYSKDT